MILEQIMKNETILWHYFDHISLQQYWFEEQVQTSLKSLGPRFNNEFNVKTKTEEILDAFLKNDDAVQAINKKRTM